MTMASPFKNPISTVSGISLIRLAPFNRPITTCKKPATIIMANINSSPSSNTTFFYTTASAAVAPEIIPGLPPNRDVITPSTTTAFNPEIGETLAIRLIAMASGI